MTGCITDSHYSVLKCLKTVRGHARSIRTVRVWSRSVLRHFGTIPYYTSYHTVLYFSYSKCLKTLRDHTRTVLVPKYPGPEVSIHKAYFTLTLSTCSEHSRQMTGVYVYHCAFTMARARALGEITRTNVRVHSRCQRSARAFTRVDEQEVGYLSIISIISVYMLVPM